MRKEKQMMFCAMAAAALVGCGVDSMEESPITQPIQGGSQTQARPEVGRLYLPDDSYCTGTLIHPSFVITAAHCLNYSADVSAGYSFQVDLPGAGSVPVSAARVFASSQFEGRASLSPQDLTNVSRWETPDGRGNTDIAILRLERAILNVSPARLTTRTPSAGQTVTTFGFGCSDRVRQTGGGYKRVASWQFSTDRADGSQRIETLCSGDSGGPVFLGGANEAGPLWGVNSTQGLFDEFGTAAHFFDEILQAMQDLTGTTYLPGLGFDGIVDAVFDAPDGLPSPFEVGAHEAVAQYCASDCAQAGLRCQGSSFSAAFDFGAWRHRWRCTRFRQVAGFVADGFAGSSFRSVERHYDRPSVPAFAEKTFAATSSERCRAACGQDSTCRMYTHKNGQCLFRGAVGQRVLALGAVSEVRSGLLVNADLSGDELERFTPSQLSWDECQSRCAKSGACKGFTYYSPKVIAPMAQCVLWRGPGALVTKGGATSSLKRGLEWGRERPGNTYSTIEFRGSGSTRAENWATASHCQALCAQDPRCFSFTFSRGIHGQTQPRCDLKAGLEPARPRAGSVSGVKGFEFF